MLAIAGCGGPVSSDDAGIVKDGSIADAPVSDGKTPDAPATDAGASGRRPPGVWITGGGGVASSGNHRIRISVGAPQPFGAASSASHYVRTGP